MGVVFLDLMIYLQHVVLHMIPFFWRFHKVHHSDLDLDVSSGFRFHPLEILGSMIYKLGLVAALGPSVMTVVVFEAILSGMAQFTHSNIKLPLGLDRTLRWLFVTPDMHRIHHSVEVAETNSNYGFNLSIWDRLLGTYIRDGKNPSRRSSSASPNSAPRRRYPCSNWCSCPFEARVNFFDFSKIEASAQDFYPIPAKIDRIRRCHQGFIGSVS